MTNGARRTATLDLVGGAPSLDFANTINSRLAPRHDYVLDYEDLVAWGLRAGIIPPAGAASLSKLADADPAGAALVVRRARRLRETIYRAFSQLAAGERLEASRGRAVLRPYGAAVARARLDPAPGTGRDSGSSSPLSWPVETTLGGLLDPIAWSAGELLLDPHRPPVKECPGCGWLFLDGSRNSSRRWCDMQTCGSRDKMRRYYRARRPRGAGHP